jgi:Tfp pilus assembly protein PilO
MTKMRQWTVMTAIAIVLILAGGFLLLVKPQGSKISGVKAQAATQQQANQVLLQEIAARLAQKANLPAEQAQLQKLAVQLPTVPDEPGVIRSLESSASGSGVNLISLTPGSAAAVTAPTTTTTLPSSSSSATSSAGSLIELPITIQVVGSYANIESYLQLLENLPRAMLVTQLALCPEAGGSGCTPVTLPTGTSPPAGALGGTLSADVFFSTTATSSSTGTTTLPGTSTATAPSTTATTPASPAATTTPAPTASSAS